MISLTLFTWKSWKLAENNKRCGHVTLNAVNETCAACKLKINIFCVKIIVWYERVNQNNWTEAENFLEINHEILRRRSKEGRSLLSETFFVANPFFSELMKLKSTEEFDSRQKLQLERLLSPTCDGHFMQRLESLLLFFSRSLYLSVYQSFNLCPPLSLTQCFFSHSFHCFLQFNRSLALEIFALSIFLSFFCKPIIFLFLFVEKIKHFHSWEYIWRSFHSTNYVKNELSWKVES